MRGFDIFLRAAKRIYQEFPDVVFIVVGTDRIAYGGDEAYVAPHKTFKDWALAQDEYDLSKFQFVGRLSPPELGKLLAATEPSRTPSPRSPKRCRTSSLHSRCSAGARTTRSRRSAAAARRKIA